MSTKASKVIAVEEYYMSENVNKAYNELFEKNCPNPAQRAKASFVDAFVNRGLITEVGEKRLANMDKAGVDV